MDAELLGDRIPYGFLDPSPRLFQRQAELVLEVLRADRHEEKDLFQSAGQGQIYLIAKSANSGRDGRAITAIQQRLYSSTLLIRDARHSGV